METWYRATEKILYEHPRNIVKARLEREEIQELFPSCVPNYDSVMVSGGEPRSKTEELGIRRAEKTVLERKVEAVNSVLEILNDEDRLLITVRYFEQRTHSEAMKSLGWCDEKYYACRNRAIAIVADCLFIRKTE